MQNILDNDFLGIHRDFLKFQDDIDFNLEEVDENITSEDLYNSGSSSWTHPQGFI